MFEWLKGIFSREEERRELSLEDAKAALEESIDKRLERIKRLLEELKAEGEMLKGKVIDVDEGDAKLRRLSNTALKQLSSRLLYLSERFRPPKTFEEKIEYCIKARGDFEKELALFWKSIVISNILAKEELRVVKRTIEELIACMDELQEVKRSAYFKLKEQAETQKRIKRLKAEVGELEKEVQEVENKLKKVVGEANRLKEEIKELEDRKKKFIEESRLGEIEKKEKEIRMLLSNNILGLKKLIQKYMSLLSKDDAEIVGKYFESLDEAILVDKRGEKLKNVLKIVREKISEEEAKRKDVERKMQKVDYLLGLDLSGLYERLIECKSKKKKITESIAEMDNKIKMLEAKLKALEAEKSKLDRERENLLRNLEAKKDLIKV